jgi:Poly A polymerase head domain.
LKQHLNLKVFSVVKNVADIENIQAFVIGGYVRDHFSKTKSKDIDIVVVGSGIDFAKKWPIPPGCAGYLL